MWGIYIYIYIYGAWGSTVVKALCWYLKGRSNPGGVCRRNFFLGATFRTTCPGIDSASKNEYQGFLLG